jgi:hypothetical protein
VCVPCSILSSHLHSTWPTHMFATARPPTCTQRHRPVHTRANVSIPVNVRAVALACAHLYILGLALVCMGHDSAATPHVCARTGHVRMCMRRQIHIACMLHLHTMYTCMPARAVLWHQARMCVCECACELITATVFLSIQPRMCLRICVTHRLRAGAA